MTDGGSWSYSAGKRASSRRPSSKVRVYERKDVPDRIFISRAWIKTESGRPVEEVLEAGATREYAEALADLTAKKREIAIMEGAPAMTREKRVSLKSLLEQFHKSRTAEDWSEGYAVDQETHRGFWRDELGDDFKVSGEEPSPGQVERIARRARKRNGWSPRTEEKYLGYLRGAVRWAWRKARLIDDNPLRGMETPDYDQDTSELIYTLDEISKLTEPHDDVDWRATLAANLAFDTGRRRRALCHVHTDGVETVRLEDPETGEERAVTFVRFEGEYEKGRRARTSWVAVSERTARLIREAVERDDVQAAGWLLPGGHLGHMGELVKKPITPSGLGSLLLEAEETLGIEHVLGRGWHGFKRRHVTELFDIAGGDVEQVKDTTGNLNAEVLRRIYRKRVREKTAPNVAALRRRLEARETSESTRESTREADPDER